MRSNHIDNLRGVLAILIVMGHVIGSDSAAGMRVPDDSLWRFVYYTIGQIRLPLFTLVAGWVYAMRPLTERSAYNYFIGKKFQRLIIPMICVGGLLYFVKCFMPSEGENFADMWRILVFPYNLYWYLFSLFWVFVVVALLDIFKVINKLGWFFVVLIGTAALYRYHNQIINPEFPNYFSFRGAIYLLPCFLMGLGAQRFKSFFTGKAAKTVMYAVFVGGLIYIMLRWFGIGGEAIMYKRTSVISILIALTSAVTLYGNTKSRFFSYIGACSYTVYLYHTMFKSFSQTAFDRLGFGPEYHWLIFACGLALGVFAPLIVDKVLSRWGITRYLLLGKSYKPKKATVQNTGV